jgi:hypothetical protein
VSADLREFANPQRRRKRLPLPTVRYVPDQSPRAVRDEVRAFLDRVLGDQEASGVRAAQRRFRYGWRLFSAGFFWEAHEVWEPLWRRAAPGSGDEAVLHGLLVASAAALRAEVGKRDAASRLAKRALTYLAEGETLRPSLRAHVPARWMRDLRRRLERFGGRRKAAAGPSPTRRTRRRSG